MKKYLFFLGRNTELAYLELRSVFQVNINRLNHDICMIELGISPSKYQDQLGSIIKIAEVLEEDIYEEEIDDFCSSYLQDFRDEALATLDLPESEKTTSKKLLFALNAYGIKMPQQFLKRHLMRIKKSCSFSLRFCNNHFSNVQSVVTYKEILKKNNLELNILPLAENLLIARTISCQNIDFYSKRDYNKPFRDAKVGMLPPKLAQILLNLANTSKVIWDPFCGLGTVPLEALLMGKKVYASDISETMIESTEKNIQWLLSEISSIQSAEYKCFQQDASEKVSLKKVDAVITEGYLGPPLYLAASEGLRQKVDRELSFLWESFFSSASSVGIKDIILCLPAYRTENRFLYMNETLEIMRRGNYKQKELSRSPRASVVYSRPNQFVCREIFHFTLCHSGLSGISGTK
jgi:tRNA G10  N-methylase Trm11